MRINLTVAKSVMLGYLVLSPVFGQAASFPCDQSIACNFAYDVKARKPQINSEKGVKSQQIAINNSPENLPKDAFTFYLEQLQLTPEQYLALHEIQQGQVPLILLSIRNLEEAHTQLRNMAINNTYDQTTADALTKTIVSHTANLAVLQAQREYEIFSMLNEAQVKRYQSLVTQLN